MRPVGYSARLDHMEFVARAKCGALFGEELVADVTYCFRNNRLYRVDVQLEGPNAYRRMSDSLQRVYGPANELEGLLTWRWPRHDIEVDIQPEHEPSKARVTFLNRSF